MHNSRTFLILKLKFGASKSNGPRNPKKSTKKSQDSAQKRKLTKAVKDEISKNNSGDIVSSNEGEVVDSSEEEPPYEWCKTYPGSIGALSNLSLKPGTTWRFKIASWNINGLRAWVKVKKPHISCIFVSLA